MKKLIVLIIVFSVLVLLSGCLIKPNAPTPITTSEGWNVHSCGNNLCESWIGEYSLNCAPDCGSPTGGVIPPLDEITDPPA